MKKTLTAKGVNGEFSGAVEIAFDHRIQNNKAYHIIYGYAGKEIFKSEEFTNKADTVSFVVKMERTVLNRLQLLANQKLEHPKTIEDILTEKGYE